MSTAFAGSAPLINASRGSPTHFALPKVPAWRRPRVADSIQRRYSRFPTCCESKSCEDESQGGMQGSFSSVEWSRSRFALDVDIAAYSIPRVDAAQSNDSNSCGTSAYITSQAAFALVDHLPSPAAKAAFIASLRASEEYNVGEAAFRGTASGQQMSVEARLCDGLRKAGAGVATSALLVEFSEQHSSIMRAAWAGVVGLIVVRDGEIIFRTHETGEARDGLERTLNIVVDDTGELRSPSSNTPTASTLPAASRRSPIFSERKSRSDSRVPPISCSDPDGGTVPPRSICDITMQSDCFELRDGDLVVAGSQTFFANLSETQMLSFVRPVVDSYDATLAIANATCLGTFRTDDVEFVSYYLAHLALNFATSDNATQLTSFPFPPGPDGHPYADGDLTVCAASISFAR